jgi:hypothetical protein
MEVQEHGAMGHVLADPQGDRPEATNSSPASPAKQASGDTHDKMRSIAGAAQHAASDLEEAFPDAANYMRTAAVQINQLLGVLRQPNIESIGTIARDTARNQPVLFFTGVAIVGFVAWRILNNLPEAARTTS